MHLLIRRCGFDYELSSKDSKHTKHKKKIDTQETVDKRSKLQQIIDDYPKLIELTSTDILLLFSKLSDLGITSNNYNVFIKLEPSLLYDEMYFKRLKFYYDMLIELECENISDILIHCAFILQRQPRQVVTVLKEYEKCEINLKYLIEKHPASLCYSLYRVKKMLSFITRFMIEGNDGNDNNSDSLSEKNSKITHKLIIEKCPEILGFNSHKLAKNIQILKSLNLFDLKRILDQSPQLLLVNDMTQMDISYNYLTNDINGIGLSKSRLMDNLQFLLFKCDTLKKRVKYLLDNYGDIINRQNISQYVDLIAYNRIEIDEKMKQRQEQREMNTTTIEIIPDNQSISDDTIDSTRQQAEQIHATVIDNSEPNEEEMIEKPLHIRILTPKERRMKNRIRRKSLVLKEY